ncbi:hypothetical protein BDQ17DRAFT_1429962 [Cyathus striatus]|nr:hypothetical protein BDQ17DRAFT_1429962 [Cyathus striatus]
MRSFITSLVLTQVLLLSFGAVSALPFRHLGRRKAPHGSSFLSGLPIVGGTMFGNVKEAGGFLSGLPTVGLLGGLIPNSGIPSSSLPVGASNSDGVNTPVEVPINNRRGLDNPPYDATQSVEALFRGEASSLPAIIMKVTDSLRLVCDELKMTIISKGPTRPEELVPLLTKIKVILAGAISDINLGIVDNPSDNLLLFNDQLFTFKTIAGLVAELFSLLVLTLGAAKHAAHSSGLRINVPLQLIADIDGLLAELLLVLCSLVSGLLDALCPRIEYLYTVLFDLHFVSMIKTLGIRG